jgi:hypoxanthine phosphoribosyltransferase
MESITIKDRSFEVSIPHSEILERVQEVADRINADFAGKKPLFVGVLNGSFMFVADLLKKINLECELSFVKVASYHGTKSSGSVKELVGLTEDIEGRDVIVIEDIVDTGNTIESIFNTLTARKPSQLKVCTLLYKPEAYTKQVPVDYVAIEIPNDFIVGYGLDYDGFGRNLQDIYTVID